MKKRSVEGGGRGNGSVFYGCQNMGILSNDPSPSSLAGKELIHIFKGTVSVILSELPFIEWHVRFTMIPFKP